MAILHCSGPCGQDKDESEFPWRNSIAGVKHRMCNACVAAASKRHYEANAPRYAARVRERRAETRSLLDNYASTQGCVTCGETDPVCLVLVPRNESATSPSTLAASGTWSYIEPQLTNYDVMCLNDRAKTQAHVHSASTNGVTE